MPIGSASSNVNLTANVPGINSSAAAGLQVAAGNNAARASQYSGISNGSVAWAPWVLIVLVGLWVFWAVAIQHERIKESFQPANIAANIHNFISVGIMASIFIVTAKIATMKATAIHLPGAGAVAHFFAAV